MDALAVAVRPCAVGIAEYSVELPGSTTDKSLNIQSCTVESSSLSFYNSQTQLEIGTPTLS